MNLLQNYRELVHLRIDDQNYGTNNLSWFPAHRQISRRMNGNRVNDRGSPSGDRERQNERRRSGVRDREWSSESHELSSSRFPQVACFGRIGGMRNNPLFVWCMRSRGKETKKSHREGDREEEEIAKWKVAGHRYRYGRKRAASRRNMQTTL